LEAPVDLLQELKALTLSLDEAGLDHALCGGLALAVYALPRATLDIDLLIPSETLDRVKAVAASLGFTFPANPMEFQGGQVQIHRLTKLDQASGQPLVLDLLLVTPATKPAWETRRFLDWDGGRLTVLSPSGLIALKSLRASGQDLDDIAYLRGLDDEA
jgi:hypothetical protein